MKKIRWLFALPLGILALYLTYILIFWNRIYPGVTVNNLSLSGKTINESAQLLAQTFKPTSTLILTAPNQEFNIQLADISISYDYSASAQRAFSLYRTGNFIYDFLNQLQAPFKPVNLGLVFNVNEDRLSTNLGVISDQVTEENQDPSVSLNGKQVQVTLGRLGKTVDLQELRIMVGQELAFNRQDKISLPFQTTGSVITAAEADRLRTRAEKLIGKSLILKLETGSSVLTSEDLVKTLGIPDYNQTEIQTLSARVAKNVNREPKDSIFTFANNQVQEFVPSQNGLIVKEDSLSNMIIGNLRELEQTDLTTLTIDVPITTTPAKIQTQDANNLGIKELIGRGTSLFGHSIPNRIFNVRLAASRFKGILVAPGDTFSFNASLGDVSALTGYKQAYIIQDGRTVLGDGGGVCQVSTTLFRAALNAGLPIIERKAHAYRVGYYEQDSPPGLDATVFAPLADLKIKNDTANYILIQSTVDPVKLAMSFEIYGTKDDRKINLTKPVISDQTPPPADLYQDDPTLPIGQIKQIDFAAWGAKVEFNYLVTRNGETLTQQKFVSYYHPWQAIFLRGTGI